MLTAIIYPSLWLTAVVLAAWASLTGRQKFAWRILLLGGAAFGSGGGLLLLDGSSFAARARWWVVILTIIGMLLVCLGAAATCGGLIGSVVRLIAALFGRRPGPVTPPEEDPAQPAEPSRSWRRRAIRLTTRVSLVYAAVLLVWTICSLGLGLGSGLWPPVTVDPADPALTQKLGITAQDWHALAQLAKDEKGYMIGGVEKMGSGSVAIDFKDPAASTTNDRDHGDIYEKKDGVWTMVAQASSFEVDDNDPDYDPHQSGLAPMVMMTPAQSALEQRSGIATFATSFESVTGINLVPIPAGTFLMGSPDNETGRRENEGPQTRVTLTKDFWLGVTDVTQAQWKAVMGGNPSAHKGPDLPVEMVSWDNAMAFCQKLNGRFASHLPTGWTFTLPTEAQWEYACRAGTTGPYAGDLDAMAWYRANSDYAPHAVGTRQPNVWGLYDMHGNAWEWCRDWYGDYPGGESTNPTGQPAGAFHVLRGGSCASEAAYCRSSFRFYLPPDFHNAGVSFRVALCPVP